MNKCNSTDFLLSREEIDRITYFANQRPRPSFKQKHQDISQDDCSFKPQINKKSLNLQRTVDDLYKWQERKVQKIQQQYEDGTFELFQSANRCSFQPDDQAPNVFDRLYVVRRSHDTIQSSKRNTSNSQPYFTKNMTTSQLSDFKKKTESPLKQSEEQNQEPPQQFKPCLPNRLFFENSESLPMAETENLKITTPQHMFIDISDEIKVANQEPEPQPFKQPLNQKDIQLMVERYRLHQSRMNNWNQKKNQKLQMQHEKNLQHESSECTFQPKLNKTPRLNYSYQPSLQSTQGPLHSTYSGLFLNKVNKY